MCVRSQDQPFLVLVLFEKNGYPTPIVRQVIQQTLDKPLAVESQKLEKVFIRLPWLGPTSAGLGYCYL